MKRLLPRMPHRRFLWRLPLGIEFAMLGIAPHDRKDWALENALVVVFMGALFASYHRLMLSRLSYLLIALFLSLHLIGAHYTYALVPYDSWFETWAGRTLNSLLGWERNNFDRVVHFCYGLLITYPIREVFQRVVRLRGFWGYFFPLNVVMSTSMIYELVEWGAATLFGGDLGQAYLGAQGDPWDAQKDMALASLGTLLSMLITAALNRWLRRDFADEWNQSPRAKNPIG